MKESGKLYDEYMELVADIILSPEIQRLENYDQHMGTSRLMHSINVSYDSYVLARFLGWNAEAAARAGLMHDMFYYNFRDVGYTAREHCREHPRIALENASRRFELTELEKDIIRAHMWLTTRTWPRYKESYLVTLVDKYCALEEFFRGLRRKIHKRKRRSLT